MYTRYESNSTNFRHRFYYVDRNNVHGSGPIIFYRCWSRYFEGVSIVKADREFMSGSYDVEMADGTELEFNKDGKIIEIDAPDGYALSNRTLGSILPAKAIETLRNLGTDQLVTNVEKTAQGYTAEIAGNDDMEYQFNNRGEIVSISYD